MPPALKALVAQLIGFGLMVATLMFGLMPPDKPLALAVFQGGVAAAAALTLRCDAWWIPIHLAFAPALYAATRLGLHPAWYFGAFLLLMLIYGSSFRTQVPLFLSNRETARVVAELLPEGKPFRLVDLGSGTGGLLRRLSKARPEASFVGIESAPLPYLFSRIASRRLTNCRVERGDFWQTGLGDFDVVYAFLSPVPMPRLWRKVKAEMKRGSLLVANSFPIQGARPERVIEVGDRRGTRLYLYRV